MLFRSIVYKKGNENRAVDALSKILCHEISCMAISSVFTTLNQQIVDSYKDDIGIQKLIQELQ